MDIRSLPDEAFTAAALKRDRRRLETALFWGGVFVGLLWLVSFAEWVALRIGKAVAPLPDAQGVLGQTGVALDVGDAVPVDAARA